MDFLRHCGHLFTRGLLVLWRILKLGDARTGALGFALVLVGVGAGVGAAIGSFFEGLPWEVSAAIFLALFLYALCRASFEVVREVREKVKAIEKQRDDLEEELEKAQAKTSGTLGYEKLVAELERVRGERDKFEKEPTARRQNEPIRDTLLKNEAKWEYVREANLSDIEELKQRCLELADRLYRFLEERRHKEMDNLQDPEMQRRSNETVELYREHFMDKIDALREDLEQRKLWGDGIIDLQGQDMAKNPTNYLTVRAIADYLNAIGNRL